MNDQDPGDPGRWAGRLAAARDGVAAEMPRAAARISVRAVSSGLTWDLVVSAELRSFQVRQDKMEVWFSGSTWHCRRRAWLPLLNLVPAGSEADT